MTDINSAPIDIKSVSTDINSVSVEESELEKLSPEDEAYKNNAFNSLRKLMHRLEQYKSIHGDKTPPMYQANDGTLVWVNRAERRRFEKAARSKKTNKAGA